MDDIGEEFQIQDCDRNEHLKHLRQLEEQRNAQEQKEIELERVQRQIINKLNITEKSNDVKGSDDTKVHPVEKLNSKQNGIHKPSKADPDKPTKTGQKAFNRRKIQPNKSTSSLHSYVACSYNHNPHSKGNSYRREGFHDMRQHRSHRSSRGRTFNYQKYQERCHRPVNNSEQEFDHSGKQQEDHAKEQVKEYFEYDLPPEIFPTNIQEEEEMLQEAIELSKQQMFIEKLERRKNSPNEFVLALRKTSVADTVNHSLALKWCVEGQGVIDSVCKRCLGNDLNQAKVKSHKTNKKWEIDKAIEETIKSQLTEHSNEDKKTPRQQSDNGIVNKEGIDASRTSFFNSDPSDHSIASDNKQGTNYNNKHEKTNYARTNFASNSRAMKHNRTQKPWLNGRPNGTTSRDSFQTQGIKSRNPSQTQKSSLNTYKQNSSNHTETTMSGKELTSEALVHSSLDKIAEFDINSSKWKECARKDLKQLLHLDNSSDSSVRTDNAEIAAKAVEASIVHGDAVGTEGSNNHGIYVNEISQKEDYYTEKHNARHHPDNNHIGNRNSCAMPAKFNDSSQNYGSSHKIMAKGRISEKRTTRGQYKGKPNNSSTDSESACACWIPYRKFVEEGRTESIPPRFRKQCQQITS